MKACNMANILTAYTKLMNDKGKIRNAVKENNKLSQSARTRNSLEKLPKIDPKKLVDLK